MAVTFTHKAAGELKLRLREELDKARVRAPLLEHALERLEEASIGTIHSFCAQILRERPVEARVDPSFEELSEQESGRIYQRAFRAWLERSLGESSPALRRAFARLAWRDSWDDTPPLEQLRDAMRAAIPKSTGQLLLVRSPRSHRRGVECGTESLRQRNRIVLPPEVHEE